MSLKNQASDAGLTRSPFLQLAIGESATTIVNLTKEAKHIKTHKVDAFVKMPCAGDGCALCGLGSKPRELWLVEVMVEDQQTGVLSPRALFLGRQEFGQLADVLPDTGLNARIRVEGVGAVSKDGAPVVAKGGQRAGQQYANMRFSLIA